MILAIGSYDFCGGIRWYLRLGRDISQESIGGAGLIYNVFDISVLSCPPMDYICKDFHADGIRAGWVGSDIQKEAFTRRYQFLTPWNLASFIAQSGHGNV